jgi:hypothetical protein
MYDVTVAVCLPLQSAGLHRICIPYKKASLARKIKSPSKDTHHVRFQDLATFSLRPSLFCGIAQRGFVVDY